MLFCLTVLDKQGQVREFRIVLHELETGLDFVSQLVAKGETVLNVWLQEGHKTTDLPLHIFDGVPFRAAMLALYQAGQALVKKPAQLGSQPQQDLIELTRKRLQLCESHIALQHGLIDRLIILQERAERQIQVVSTRLALIRHYQQQIDSYTRQISHNQLSQQQIGQRLNRLLVD